MKKKKRAKGYKTGVKHHLFANDCDYELGNGKITVQERRCVSCFSFHFFAFEREPFNVFSFN